MRSNTNTNCYVQHISWEVYRIHNLNVLLIAGSFNKISRTLRNYQLKLFNPADIYKLKVNNSNTETKCKICSKLTIKTQERCQITSFWYLYCKL